MAFNSKPTSQDFKVNAAQLTGAVLAATSELTETFAKAGQAITAPEPDDVLDVKNVFNIAGMNEERANLERSMVAGALSANQIGVAVSGAAKHLAEQEERERKQRERYNDVAFLALMDQLDNAVEELGQARKELAVAREKMIELYGENYLDVLAKTYLDEESAKRLPGESDEDYELRLAELIKQGVDNDEISLANDVDKNWLDAAVKTKMKKDAALDLREEAAAVYGETKDTEKMFETIKGHSVNEKVDASGSLKTQSDKNPIIKEVFETAAATSVLEGNDEPDSSVSKEQSEADLDALMKNSGISLG